ncbi:hypothetical protein BDV3_004769 [Batrachochytrium dendrobatidis]
MIKRHSHQSVASVIHQSIVSVYTCSTASHSRHFYMASLPFTNSTFFKCSLNSHMSMSLSTATHFSSKLNPAIDTRNLPIQYTLHVETIRTLCDLFQNKRRDLKPTDITRVWDLCRILIKNDTSSIKNLLEVEQLMHRLVAFLALSPENHNAVEQTEKLLIWWRPGNKWSDLTSQDILWIVRAYKVKTVQQGLDIISSICRKCNLKRLDSTVVYILIVSIAIRHSSKEAIEFIKAFVAQQQRSIQPSIHLNYLLQTCCQEISFMQQHSGILDISVKEANAQVKSISEFMLDLVAYMSTASPNPALADVVSFNYIAFSQKCTTYTDVVRVLDTMQSYGVYPNIKTFTTLVHNLDADSAIKLFEKANEMGLQTDASILVSYIRACKLRPDQSSGKRDALKAFLAHPYRLELTSPTYADSGILFILSAIYSYEYKLDVTLQVINDMIQSGWRIPPERFKHIISRLCYSHLVKDAVELLDRAMLMSKAYASVDTRTTIVAGWCATGYPDSALKFIDTMLEKGLAPTMQMYRWIIDSLITMRKLGDADRVAIMCRDKVNVVTIDAFHAVTRAYLIFGHADEAERRIKHINTYGFIADDTTHAIWVATLLKLGKRDEAESKLKSLGAYYGGVKHVPVAVYTAFMDVAILEHDWINVIKYWRKIIGCARGGVSGVEDAIVAKYITGAIQLDRFDAIQSVIKQVQWETHPKTYRAYVYVCFKSGNVMKGQRVVEDVLTIAHSQRTQFVKAQNTDRALAYRDLPHAKYLAEILCDVVGYYASDLGNLSHAKQTLRVYLEMFKPTSRPFVSLMRAAVHHAKFSDPSGGLDEAMQYWKWMVQAGGRVNQSGYGGWISACVDAGDVCRAIQGIQLLVQAKFKPTVAIQQTVLTMLGRCGRISEMERLFKRLLTNDDSKAFVSVPATSATVNALMTGYLHSKNYAKLFLVWNRLWKRSGGGSDAQVPVFTSNDPSIETCIHVANAKDILDVDMLVPDLADLVEHDQFASDVNTQADESIQDLYDETHEHNETDSLLDTSMTPLSLPWTTTMNTDHGVTPVTFCLVLDALGFAGDLEVLDKVWQQVVDVDKFPISPNCTTSYMEALMRCGQTDRAMEVVIGACKTGKVAVKTVVNFLGMCDDGEQGKHRKEQVMKCVKKECTLEFTEILQQRLDGGKSQTKTRKIPSDQNIDQVLQLFKLTAD